MSLPRMPLERHQKVAFAILTAAFLLYWWQPTLTLVGVAALVVLPPLLYLTFRLADGDAEPIVLLWLAICPMGYYFLSFPRQNPVISLDRMVVVLLLAAIALCPPERVTRIPNSLSRCAWAWGVFLLAAVVSLVNVKGFQSSLSFLVDVFLLPAVLGWYVIACFPVRRYLHLLHTIICVVTIYSCAIGLAEIVLGTDLMPFAGANEYRAGDTTLDILRVNGPYSVNNSFGLIGLVTFCLLGFLRHNMGKDVSRWRKLLHGIAIVAAAAQALLPLFRSIAITLIIILCLDLFREISRRQKLLRVAVLALIGGSVLVVALSVEGLFEERISNADNFYVRIAQQKQNFRIFLDNPILGVGFNNYYAVASSKPGSAASYEGTESLDYPHSNLGAVLAETGVIGVTPFVISQILLVAAFWRLRKSGKASGNSVWIFFVYIFISYWISGSALTSGYYSDLNLWYMFALAVVYKYAITQTASSLPVPTVGAQGPVAQNRREHQLSR